MVSIGPLDFVITLGIIVIIYVLILNQNKATLERSEIVVISIIGAVGLLFRLISFFLSVTHDPDTLAFINRSTMVLNGMTSFRDFSDPKPLWTHTLAAWFYFFGISVENLLLLLITVDVSTILLIFFIGKDFLSKKEGYLASMFYAFNPFSIIFCSAEGKMDIIPVLCALLAFWFLKKEKIDLSAILLGIGIMYKYLAGLYFIPFLFFLKKSWNRIDIIRYIVECALTCTLIALPFLLISPSQFISETFLFFVTKEMSRWMHDLHPYNYLPFYVPLIFVWTAWIVIIFLTASINDFGIKDELRVLFFFIMFTILLNRTLFTQYFTYTIPILGFLFAQDFIKVESGKLPFSWRTIAACLIPFLLSLELLNVFGVKSLPFPLQTEQWMGAMDIHIYFGILISTLALFIDWIIDLKNENRLIPPKLILRKTFGRF